MRKAFLVSISRFQHYGIIAINIENFEVSKKQIMNV